MTGVIIALFICTTVLLIAIIVSRTIENIQTHDSYWKAKYELEKADMYSVQKLNADIIENAKTVIRVNEELIKMFKDQVKELTDEPTNEAAE